MVQLVDDRFETHLSLAEVASRLRVTPRQLADLVAFVASPLGRTISGQALSVCGDTNMLA